MGGDPVPRWFFDRAVIVFDWQADFAALVWHQWRRSPFDSETLSDLIRRATDRLGPDKEETAAAVMQRAHQVCLAMPACGSNS